MSSRPPDRARRAAAVRAALVGTLPVFGAPASAADGYDLTTFFRSETAAQYGEYNGLEGDGQGVALNADLSTALAFGTERHLDLTLRNVGLDTYLARFGLREAGRFRIALSIEGQQQIERLDLSSPYVPSTLTLPAGWVAGADTTALTGLTRFANGNLTEETGRQIVRLEADWQASDRTGFGLDYRWEKFDGTQFRGVALYANAGSNVPAVHLPVPVNAIEQSLELSSYTRLLGTSVNLTGGWSRFNNSVSLLEWQNPWAIGLPGVDYPDGSGALSGAPDHERFFGSIAFAARPAPGLSVTFDADGSLTTMDDALAPWTPNDSLLTPLPLPLDRFDVDQGNLALRGRLRYRPTNGAMRRAAIRLSWRYQERDSDLPREAWVYPRGDATDQPDAALALFNTVHDTSLEKIVGGLDVRTPWRGMVTAEVHRLERNRDNAAVNTNVTEGIRGSYRFRPVASLALRFETLIETTDASTYDFRRSFYLRRTETFVEATPTEQQYDNHPFLRQYHLAPHEARAWRARATWTPTVDGRFQFQLGGRVDVRERKYEDSPFGLVSRDAQTYGIDASLAIGTDLNLSSWASVEFADVRSVGRSFGGGIEKAANQVTPPLPQASDPDRDWTSDFEDRLLALGVAVDWQPLPNWTLHGDYTLTLTNSGQRLDSGAGLDTGGNLPTVETDLHHLRVRAERALVADFRVGFAWEYYRFDQSDWRFTDVDLTTLDNVLLAGARNHDEVVNLLALSVSRRF